MKADVFFILDSFDFDGSVENLFSTLTEASALVNKVQSDKFVKFSKSSDFYDNAVNKLYGPNAAPEVGQLAALIYDGGMSKATIRDITSCKVVACINAEIAVHEEHWLSVYGTLPPSVNINDPIRNTISEADIIEYSKTIVLANKYDSNGYADAFEGIYRNLTFHPKYNDIQKITGGCDNFINGIFEMFDSMNSLTPKDNGVKEDIHFLDKSIKFTTCEEGGGKKKRKINFDFEINGSKQTYNCEYHCKLEYFDNQYKKGKYHNDNRMYFGFYKPESETEANKFLIAHLGDHL